MFLEARQITSGSRPSRPRGRGHIDREGEIDAVVGETAPQEHPHEHPDRDDPARHRSIRIDGREVVLQRAIDAQRRASPSCPRRSISSRRRADGDRVPGAGAPDPGRPYRLEETERRTREFLARIGTDIDPRAKLRDLSTAQRQLVQIARAFAFGARVLIMDEPTASLTTRESDKLFQIARNHQSTGGSIFNISHRLEEIQEIAGRISVLRDGRKVTELDARRATIDEMIQHMVGAAVERAEGRRPPPEGRRVVLRVDRLTRAGEFRDVSFELHQGEILGIAGLVGAGRTELVKCIFGRGDAAAVRGRLHRRREGEHPVAAPGDRSSVAYVPEAAGAWGSSRC